MPTVALAADSFWLIADGKCFSPGASVLLQSDSGDGTYTTLEIIWSEQGREMRFFISLHADSNGWWSDEMRTYDAQVPHPDWLNYHGAFIDTASGATFSGNLDLTSDDTNPIRGELHLHGLRVSTTLTGR